ncbi:hypothetical protein DLAC_01217 [Tieghemostelium lacteum]|uniref:EGF-like domain-containing protein n=1 Tax=Tieghemostelium lacteum TaxID=361077 RepID=A0A152A817_TIELA|nr:hypothetical protein DLAC_01217 [Tieghemostelium lacteum]|eukprot:KYR02379.1 hypothetical protein DLAC_01217 [Tieghemostelium lacteum]
MRGYHLSLFVLLLICTIIKAEPFFYNPANDHYYTYVLGSSPISRADAVTACSSLPLYQGYKGYLVTINSKDEYEILKNNIFKLPSENLRQFWISGNNLDNTNIFKYDTGPESGQNFYIVNQDRTHYFADFQFAHPNSLDTNNYVIVNYDSFYSYHMESSTSGASVMNYVCEFGGLEKPFVPSADTKDGTVTFSGTSGFPADWVFTNMSITFTRPGQPLNTGVDCQQLSMVSPNVYQCQTPNSNGVYDINFVEATSRVVAVKGWHYRPPWISVVYPSAIIGSVVTIAGYNFGSVASDISVYIGTGQDQCINQNLFVNQLVIVCTLNAAPTKFLPVSVVSNSVGYTSYKPSVYWSTNQKYYIGINSRCTFNYYGYSYPNNLYGSYGNKAITTTALYDWYLTMFPNIPVTEEYTQWENVFHTTEGFYSLVDSSSVNLYYTVENITFPTTATRFYLSWGGQTIINSVQDQWAADRAGLLIENPVYSPSLEPITLYVDTTGGVIEARIVFFGPPINSQLYDFKFQGNSLAFENFQLYNPDNLSQMVYITIPPGIGNGTLSATINGASIPSATTVMYYLPWITNVTFAVIETGLITVTGANFGNQLGAITVLVDGAATCGNLQMLEPHTKVSCEMGLGRGIRNITLQIGDVVSHYYITHYIDPILTGIAQSSDKITINGNGFGVVSNTFYALTIQLGVTTFTSINSYCVGASDTLITCVIPDTFSFRGSGRLRIIGDFPTLVFNVNFGPYITKISETLFDTDTTITMTITGMFFDDSTPITVSIPTIPSNLIGNITSYDYNTLYFPVPQYTGKLHTLRIATRDNFPSNVVKFSYEPPTITSITNYLYNNVYWLTITGTQLGTVSSNINVLYNTKGVTFNSFTSANNSVIVSIPDRSYSSSAIVELVVNTQANSQNITLKPLIVSITNKPPVLGGDITIHGYYFSENAIVTLIAPNNSTVTLTKNYSTVLDGWIAIATVTPGTGTFGIKLSIQTVESDVLQFSYQSPIIREATELYFNQPGNVTITGDNFGQVNPTVTIGYMPCTNPFVLSTNKLVCYFSANVTSENGESLDVSVTVDSLTGSNQVFFYTLDKDCEKNCSGHGDCDRTTSTCTCYTGFTGSDCSIKNNTKPEPPKTDGNGNTNLPGQSVNFNISLAFIREKKFDDSIVKVLDLTTMNIIEKKLIQPNTSFFKGVFNNNNVSVQFNVTYYPTQTTIDFAGEPIQQPSNSIKYQISIFDWDFDEQTNHLELIYKSSTPSVSELNCEETQTNSTNNIDNYRGYKIQAGSDLFETKFSDRMIVDNRLLKSRISQLPESDPLYQQIGNTEQDELSILISLSTPYFRHFCTLDPNFSVLLTTESTNDDDNECSSKNNKWKLPVILVVSIVGGLSIIVAVIVLVKKEIILKRQKQILMKRISDNFS